MIKYLRFLSVVFSFLLVACQGDRSAEEQKPLAKPKVSRIDLDYKIQLLEAKLYGKNASFDANLASAAIQLYVEYANNFPNDKKTPKYLFKAGEISNSLGESRNAIAYFDRIYKDYPGFDKYPYTLFLQGFIYETQLDELGKAKEIYEKVITEFPNHQVAQDAAGSLQNLGKSPEQLIREFEKKNKGKS